MNKRGMSLISTLFLMSVILFLVVAQIGGISKLEFKSIVNPVLENASNKINSINFTFNSTQESVNSILNQTLRPYLKLTFYYLMEIWKIGINLGIDLYYEYPNLINPQLIMKLLILSLLAPLIIPLVKLFIIIVLFISEFIQERKEKKDENK